MPRQLQAPALGTTMPLPHFSSLRAHLRHVARYNLHTLRTAPLPEISGALGDLPTFLPLFLALTQRGLIAPGATLILAGLTNVSTGLLFGIPLPVQPMKAIAAAALLPSADLATADVASAGLFVGACIALLTLTGTLARFTRAVPRSVVRGVQLGAGLGLAGGAAGTVRDAVVDGFVEDSLAFVFALALLVPATLAPRRVPYVLILLGLSIVGPLLAVATSCAVRQDCSWPGWAFAIGSFEFWVPDERHFARGALGPGLAQLPLTTLNSVVAVVYLAQDLFPDAARELAGPRTPPENEQPAVETGAPWRRPPPALRGPSPAGSGDRPDRGCSTPSGRWGCRRRGSRRWPRRSG